MIDYHVHSNISYDGKSSPQEYIDIAHLKGIKEFTFTEHFDYLNGVSNINLDNYYSSFKNLTIPDDLSVNFGVEVGFNKHYKTTIESAISKYPFDFIIGSSHSIGGFEINDELFDSRCRSDVYLMYFNEIINNIKLFTNYDVYGHLDHIVRYGNFDDNIFDYINYINIIDEILKVIISNGKGLEVNSSGYRFNSNKPYPCVDILKRYKELGGEIITVGSDAHKYWELGRDLDIVYELLLKCGFDYINIFHNRNVSYVKIKK